MIWVVILLLSIIFLFLYLLPLLFKGVPFQPTPRSSARRMLEMAKLGKDDLVYDLGCGTGRILVEAARGFGAMAVGIEVNPLLYLWSLLNVRRAGVCDRVKVKFGNFFDADLSEATVVTVFQFGGSNTKLKEKLQHELSPGARVVSYHWPFSGWNASAVDNGKEVFLYEISKIMDKGENFGK